MDAVGGDEEEEEDGLEGGEGDVCGDNNGGGWARREYGVEEIGEEAGHDGDVATRLPSWTRTSDRSSSGYLCRCR